MMRPKVNAVVLAGTHQDPRRLVHGQNKALLPINHRPLLGHVIDALRAAPSIASIMIVGPADLIRQHLPDLSSDIAVIPQGSSLVENAWRGFMAVAADAEQSSGSALRSGPQGPAMEMMEQIDPVDHLLADIAAAVADTDSGVISVQTAQVILAKHLRRSFRLDGFRSRISGARLERLFWEHSAINIAAGHIRFSTDDLFAAYLQLHNWLNESVLFVPGDIPLVTPEAIEDFLLRCGTYEQDFYFGIVKEEDLTAYYPRGQTPGVIRPYVHLREARVRIFNLVLAKPKLIARAWLVKSGFDFRKMVHWSNVVQVARVLAGLRGRFWGLYYLSVLQLAAICRRNGLERLALRIARACPLYGLEFHLSRLLGTDFQLVLTPFGGPAIDVDNAEDYAIIQQNFDGWLAFQAECARETGQACLPIVRPSAKLPGY